MNGLEEVSLWKGWLHREAGDSDRASSSQFVSTRVCYAWGTMRYDLVMNFVGTNHGEPCPHCGITVVFSTTPKGRVPIEIIEHDFFDPSGSSLHWGKCPACSKLVIDFISWRGEHGVVVDSERLYPVVAIPPPLSTDIPARIADEYREAAKLRTISPRASATLARRCLQMALRDNGFEAKTLFKEIEIAKNDSRCSSDLIEKFNMVREVGNYAAHPTEDGSGNFLSVEPGELELLFAALEELFDVFYVKPKQHERLMSDVKRKIEIAKKPVEPVAGS